MTAVLLSFGAVVGGGKSLVFTTQIRTPQQLGLGFRVRIMVSVRIEYMSHTHPTKFTAIQLDYDMYTLMQ